MLCKTCRKFARVVWTGGPLVGMRNTGAVPIARFLNKLFGVCHLDRVRRTLSLSKGTEGEWRDPGNLSSAMLRQGVRTKLRMPTGLGLDQAVGRGRSFQSGKCVR